MLYLLGGTPASGKTSIAMRFLSENGVAFFPLDWLAIGVALGLPTTGVDPEDDEFKVGELIWPIVKSMATQAIREGRYGYLIEGAQLQPKHARELSDEWPGLIRACFLGFAEMDTMEKFRQIRRVGGGEYARWDDQRVISEIERLKEFSTRLRAECLKHGVTYKEVPTDLTATAGRVIQYLQGKEP